MYDTDERIDPEHFIRSKNDDEVLNDFENFRSGDIAVTIRNDSIFE
jgi:hypothetical protein